ncbi:hypothetical protein [Bacteroides reticulotermitis]|uniref:hypothetical protein n=1 Tax=Bacteroides reticulotermitis TaxID=1133319 RepID=UPI003A87FFEB
MELMNSLKIDEWWKAVLVTGAALIAISLLFRIDIVNRKHLLGIGVGMFIIGISNWMCIRTVIHSRPDLGGNFSGLMPIHNGFTKWLQRTGFIITVVFAGLLIWELI